MADIANLVLAVDSSQVAKGTAALDGLTAAGARAEASTGRLAGGVKGAGVEAAAMAVAAQTSARAAMDQAAGFGVATEAARVNTLALRETLVVARELSRGNFTRVPGSLTLLAQGIGSQGGISAFASAITQQLGLIKKVQDAELAEAAVAAETAAAGLRAAAERAGANVLAADTELALAQEQVRTATTAAEEALAQKALATALNQVAEAAIRAQVAQGALTQAEGEAALANLNNLKATRTVIGGTGAGLIGVGIAAVGAELGFKALQATVDDTGALDRYAASITKNKEQLQELSDKLGGFQITWGDVFHGIAKAAGDALGASSIWEAFKEGNKSAFADALHSAVDWAANCYGIVRGTYQSVVDIWDKFPAAMGDAFYSAVNIAIQALNKLVKFGTDQLNSLIDSANKLPFVNLGHVSASQIGDVGNPYAGQGKALNDALANNIPRFRNEARNRINAGLGTIYDDIVGAAEDRIRGGLPRQRTARGRHPHEKANSADEELSKLDAQIAGENALAQAYLDSDAAAIKAQADEKAMALALEKHASASQLAALKTKELALAVATIAKDGAKRVADLRFEADSRAAVNSQIAAGIIPASQANEALQLENARREIAAGLVHAEGQQKADLLNIERQLTKSYGDNRAEIEKTNALNQVASNNNEIERLQLRNTLLGKSNEEIAVALAHLETMQYLRDHPGIDSSTAASLADSNVRKAIANVQTPFQQWAATVPQDAKAITEALQGIEFRGFDQLASSITGVITGTKSLGAAFRDVANSIIQEIIQMTVRMLIFKAVSSVFGGGGGFNPADMGSFNFGGLSSAKPHFANGGSMIIGGNSGVDNNVLSLNGKPIAMVGQGETLAVYPNRPQAANDKPHLVVVQVATDENFTASVQSTAAQTVIAAAPHIAQAGAETAIRTMNRPRLMNG